jgi:hypothetical protein
MVFSQVDQFAEGVRVCDQYRPGRSGRLPGALVMRRSWVRFPQAAPPNTRSQACRGLERDSFGPVRGTNVCVAPNG